MKKIFFTLAILMFSVSANAVNSARGTVGVLTFSDGGNLFFTTTAPALNPANCEASSYVIAKINPEFRNYYAIMLTAQASGAEVVVRISPNTCTDLGGVTYPRAILVQQFAS